MSNSVCSHPLSYAEALRKSSKDTPQLSVPFAGLKKQTSFSNYTKRQERNWEWKRRQSASSADFRQQSYTDKNNRTFGNRSVSYSKIRNYKIESKENLDPVRTTSPRTFSAKEVKIPKQSYQEQNKSLDAPSASIPTTNSFSVLDDASDSVPIINIEIHDPKETGLVAEKDISPMKRTINKKNKCNDKILQNKNYDFGKSFTDKFEIFYESNADPRIRDNLTLDSSIFRESCKNIAKHSNYVKSTAILSPNSCRNLPKTNIETKGRIEFTNPAYDEARHLENNLKGCHAPNKMYSAPPNNEHKVVIVKQRTNEKNYINEDQDQGVQNSFGPPINEPSEILPISSKHANSENVILVTKYPYESKPDSRKKQIENSSYLKVDEKIIDSRKECVHERDYLEMANDDDGFFCIKQTIEELDKEIIQDMKDADSRKAFLCLKQKMEGLYTKVSQDVKDADSKGAFLGLNDTKLNVNTDANLTEILQIKDENANPRNNLDFVKDYIVLKEDICSDLNEIDELKPVEIDKNMKELYGLSTDIAEDSELEISMETENLLSSGNVDDFTHSNIGGKSEADCPQLPLSSEISLTDSVNSCSNKSRYLPPTTLINENLNRNTPEPCVSVEKTLPPVLENVKKIRENDNSLLLELLKRDPIVECKSNDVIYNVIFDEKTVNHEKMVNTDMECNTFKTEMIDVFSPSDSHGNEPMQPNEHGFSINPFMNHVNYINVPYIINSQQCYATDSLDCNKQISQVTPENMSNRRSLCSPKSALYIRAHRGFDNFAYNYADDLNIAVNGEMRTDANGQYIIALADSNGLTKYYQLDQEKYNMFLSKFGFPHFGRPNVYWSPPITQSSLNPKANNFWPGYPYEFAQLSSNYGI